MSAPVLEGVGLGFAAGEHTVLRDASVAVGPGELVAVEGPSGAGKTVLLTLLLRLRPVEQGTVRWEGDDVTALSFGALRSRRRRVQALLQHTGASLPPYLTVRQALDETRSHVGGGDPAELVQALGLAGLLDRHPRHLSGGEQRRAGLARLFLAEPAVAVVDEPDAGLDPPSQVAVLQRLRDRCDAGMGCLLVTHQRGLARRFADRVLALREGALHAA